MINLLALEKAKRLFLSLKKRKKKPSKIILLLRKLRKEKNQEITTRRVSRTKTFPLFSFKMKRKNRILSSLKSKKTMKKKMISQRKVLYKKSSVITL